MKPTPQIQYNDTSSGDNIVGITDSQSESI